MDASLPSSEKAYKLEAMTQEQVRRPILICRVKEQGSSVVYFFPLLGWEEGGVVDS